MLFVICIYVPTLNNIYLLTYLLTYWLKKNLLTYLLTGEQSVLITIIHTT